MRKLLAPRGARHWTPNRWSRALRLEIREQCRDHGFGPVAVARATRRGILHSVAAWWGFRPYYVSDLHYLSVLLGVPAADLVPASTGAA